MKYNMSMRIYKRLLSGFMRNEGLEKQKIRETEKEYRRIMEGAKDIGAGNNLLSSYCFAAFFIAMNRKDGFDPEANYRIFEKGFAGSRIMKMALGNADSYFSEKKLKQRLKWAEETKKQKYENDWMLDVFPPDGEYEIGYDYYKCGVCALCRDENCFELAKYLCRLDFMIADIIGIKLDRTMTLADGDEKCDFRFKRKEEE